MKKDTLLAIDQVIMAYEDFHRTPTPASWERVFTTEENSPEPLKAFLTLLTQNSLCNHEILKSLKTLIEEEP